MLRQKSILDMFGRSPMRPLRQHMKKAHACVADLLPFYEAVNAGNWDEAIVLYEKIRSLEHDADAIKCDLRLHLPKGLFLPVPRSDLLGLLAKQERLANRAKDIAGIMLGRKICIPRELSEAFGVYLSRSVDASNQATCAINELDDLLESGFRGKEVSLVEKMIQELNVIEHETDTMQIDLREKLFRIETSLKPVDVMFLYKIIDWIGYLANDAQQAGYQLQLLLAD